jgi:hypothetical protein
VTQQATIRSWLGNEGFVERFGVVLTDGRRCELRWADCDRATVEDSTTRVRDAAAFLTQHPHVVAPTVIGTVSGKNGVGALVESFEGPAVHSLCDDPLHPEVALEIASRLVDYLLHLASLRDSWNRRFEVAVRSLTTRTVRVRADGSVCLSTLETLGGDWPGRVVRTGRIDKGRATRTSLLGKGPADDIFDLALVMVALLAGNAVAERLDSTLQPLADAADHDAAVTRALSPRNLERLPLTLRPLLQRMLAFYPDERPSPADVRRSLLEHFASPASLTDYARTVATGYRWLPHGIHPMIGQRLRVDGTTSPGSPNQADPFEDEPTEESKGPYKVVELHRLAQKKRPPRPKTTDIPIRLHGSVSRSQRPRTTEPAVDRGSDTAARKLKRRKAGTPAPSTRRPPAVVASTQRPAPTIRYKIDKPVAPPVASSGPSPLMGCILLSLMLVFAACAGSCTGMLFVIVLALSSA